jgi:hypothetical protein
MAIFDLRDRRSCFATCREAGAESVVFLQEWENADPNLPEAATARQFFASTQTRSRLYRIGESDSSTRKSIERPAGWQSHCTFNLNSPTEHEKGIVQCLTDIRMAVVAAAIFFG